MKKTLLFIIALSISLTSFSQTVWAPIQNIDPDPGTDPYVIASGDLDGDLDIDIVMGTFSFSNDVIKWYANDGDGNFTLQPTVSSTGVLNGIGGLAIADIDGINGNDIISVSYSDNSLVWYANDGSGGFSAEQEISNAVGGAGQVTISDINNDGNLDVSVAAYLGNEAVWFPGNGDGTFGTKQIIASVALPGNVSFADFDNDGDLDALIGFDDGAGGTSGTIEIYYNQYIESGTMTVSWIKDTVTVDSGNPFLFVAAFADVNDDGILDIVKSDNTSGEVAWYSKIKNGASTETMISDETIIDRPAVVAVADLDNDSFNDVIVTDGGTADDAIIWFESTDSGTLNMEATIADNNYQMYGITIADFDADGDKDIATVGFSLDRIDWLENQLETLSVDDVVTQNLSIYPNPAKNVLNFNGMTSETLNLEVYDILGKSIIKTTIEQNGSLDISELKSGLYIIKFENINSAYKFVKE
nr:T9SS type A sorting domain-containing protein [uncultured Psychroserpens sp.]